MQEQLYHWHVRTERARHSSDSLWSRYTVPVCTAAIPSLHGEDTNEAITMPTLSQSAYIAWQLASGEAMHSGHQYIENADVFIGICKLGTWLRAMKQRGKLVPNGKIDLRGLYAEAEIVEEALRTFALSPTTLSNTVRTVV